MKAECQNQLVYMLEEEPLKLHVTNAQNQLVYMLEEQPLNPYMINAECSESLFMRSTSPTTKCDSA